MRLNSIVQFAFTTLSLSLALGVSGCSGGGGGGGDDDDDGGSNVPAITALTPGSGIIGTEVTITGENFGAAQGTATVTFGGLNAAVISWSDAQVVAEVPADAYPGPRDVVVTVVEASAPFSFRVTLPRALYSNNDGPATSVTAFTTSSGAFVGTALVVGTGGSSSFGGDSSGIVLHEGTRRLFSTHLGLIAVFDVDPVTGLLTEVAGSPFTTGATRLFGIDVNDAGDAVYGADCGSDDGVIAMSVDANGALSNLPGSPHVYASTNCIDVVRLTGDESFLVASVEDGTVRTYSVGGDGALTEVGGSPFSFPNDGSNYGFDMHPNRNVFYIPSKTNGALYAWAVQPVTGAPMIVDSAAVAQTAMSAFAFSDDGNRLFASPSGGTELYVFDLDSSGAMTAAAGVPFFLTNTVYPIEVSGSTLWGGGVDGMLYEHSLSGTGAPSAQGTPVPNGVSESINALAVTR